MITVSTYRLKNGLRLLHHFDGVTKMVAVNLLYDVGSRDELKGRTGLAHLMEHLMFTGSKEAPNFDSCLQAAGGESNAWTSADVTNYYETLPTHNVETAFWLEADRLQNLNLRESSITTQKSVVIEEFKQRCLNVPYGDIVHIVNSLAYKEHSYRWPTIGERVEDIEQASSEEIKSFFKSHYAVNNLILCVSGNVAFDDAVALTEKWFGGIDSQPLVSRNIPREPEQTDLRFLAVHRDHVPQDLIYMIYHMGGRSDENYQTCDLLSDVLSSGMSSRFYQNVLLKTGLFTELDASISGTMDPGLFLVRGSLAHDVKFDDARRAIEAELQNLLTGGVTTQELEKYCNKYQANSLFENIGYAEKAVKLCKYELLSSAHDVNREIEKYRSVTPAHMIEVARNLFSPGNTSVLYYGPTA